MNKKIFYIVTVVCAIVMVMACIPTVHLRLINEKMNNNVVVSLNYNEFYDKLGEDELSNQIEKYKEIGVNTVAIDVTQIDYSKKYLESAQEHGLSITLLCKLCDNLEKNYLDDLEKIIDDYNVKYINIENELNNSNNTIYDGVIELIQKYNMTVVLSETENINQIGNKKSLDFKNMGEAFTNSVTRAYRIIIYNKDEKIDAKRFYYKYLNSTIDRNIRFIVVTLQKDDEIEVQESASVSFEAISMYISKLKQLGYSINEKPGLFYYNGAGRVVYCASGILMLIMLMYIIFLLMGRINKKIVIADFILIILSAFVSLFLASQSILRLYSTMWAIIFPCFMITLVMRYIKVMKEKLSIFKLIISTSCIIFGGMVIGALVQLAQLSGLLYYIDEVLFRGVKVSVGIPVLYGILAYWFVFIWEKDSLYKNFKSLIFADVRWYGVILITVFLGVMYFYIVRSGGVASLNNLEQLVRDKITDIFIARPRTKEFLIGYPSLILLIFYLKKDCKKIGWIFSFGTSMLIVSISNSFCHTFTNAITIYLRVVNGLILGIVVGSVGYFINLLVYKIFKKYKML